jgi:hypothetical protein
VSPIGAGLDEHGRTRNRAPIGDEPDEFVIGGTANGRSRDTNFQRIAMNSDAFRAGGLG